MAGYVTLEHLEKQLKLMDEQYLSVVYGHEYVTKDEYDQLKADGNINENKLYIIIDDDASARGAGVVSGYYNSTNKKFYKDSTFTEEITGVEGGLYVDITANVLYRYDGTKFIAISSSSSNIWQGTKAEYEAAEAAGEIKPGTLIIITDDDGDSSMIHWIGTSAEWSAVDKDTIPDGTVVILTDAQGENPIATTWSSTPKDTNIPSEKLVKDSLDDKADKTDINTIYDDGFASKNIFNEQMEIGGIDVSSGASVTYTTRMRSVGYTEIDPNKSYYICTQSTVSTSATKLRIFYYDNNKTFISYQDWTNTLTIPSNAKYIRFITIDGYGTTYNNDICLNVSDSKNGTYRPYAKSNVELTDKYDENVADGYLKPNNLYDSDIMKLYHKSYDTSNGSLVDNSNIICTTKISATPNTMYMVSNTSVFRILYWNNDTYKGTETRSDSNVFTVPSDVNKFAIQVGETVYSDDMEISVATKSNTELTEMLSNLFVTELVKRDSISLNANTLGTEVVVSVEKTGYTAIGSVGFYFSGTNSNALHCSEITTNATHLYTTVSNTSNINVSNVSLTVKVLYMKNI